MAIVEENTGYRMTRYRKLQIDDNWNKAEKWKQLNSKDRLKEILKMCQEDKMNTNHRGICREVENASEDGENT